MRFLLFQIKGSGSPNTRVESEDSDPLNETLLKLVRQRSNLWRDAYLTFSGHRRPGIKKGLSLKEAKEQSEELTKKINRLLEKHLENK